MLNIAPSVRTIHTIGGHKVTVKIPVTQPSGLLKATHMLLKCENCSNLVIVPKDYRGSVVCHGHH